VYGLLGDAETVPGRPVNPSMYRWADWRRKQHDGSGGCHRAKSLSMLKRYTHLHAANLAKKLRDALRAGVGAPQH
jgi:hypothetical protein